ncbi:hypothetical protein ACFQL4_09710 [Halosimplex aquaticum]
MQPQRLRRNFESVAFTTAVPFTDDRSEVDTAALADNVERLYDRGARLFIPCGNTGSTTRSPTRSGPRSSRHTSKRPGRKRPSPAV